jgi:hypothetical protein
MIDPFSRCKLYASSAASNWGRVAGRYHQNEIHNVIAITLGAGIFDKCCWVVAAVDILCAIYSNNSQSFWRA